MWEIFYFLFKRVMLDTFPDEKKCPSYKGACLIEVIFNKNQRKRKLGVFQSYDMNIDSHPHFSEEGKMQGV